MFLELFGSNFYFYSKGDTPFFSIALKLNLYYLNLSVRIPVNKLNHDSADAARKIKHINILHPPDESHLSNPAEDVCGEVLYLHPTLAACSQKSHLPPLMGSESFTGACLPLHASERNFAREETLRKPLNLPQSACVYPGNGPCCSVPF